MIRFTERRLRAMMIAAGALTLTAGTAAVGMAATSGSHAGTSNQPAGRSHAVALASPAAPFLCLAYAHQWGICVGPPTN